MIKSSGTTFPFSRKIFSWLVNRKEQLLVSTENGFSHPMNFLPLYLELADFGLAIEVVGDQTLWHG